MSHGLHDCRHVMMSTVDSISRIYFYRSVEIPFQIAELIAKNQGGSTPCDGICCALELAEPYQPNIQYSMTAKKEQRTHRRSLCKEWFPDHTWLTFCTTRNKAFCLFCRNASLRHLLNFSRKSEDAFVAGS